MLPLIRSARVSSTLFFAPPLFKNPPGGFNRHPSLRSRRRKEQNATRQCTASQRGGGRARHVRGCC
ncbi:hypothetical protein E1A91_D04G019400v1 [Gossypium mustelinum]|uniref:Uncharacterized protein n=1 Tax=Gossypium mustelinum TaxID=34275 RepID=A0A5D2V8V8_GOSMU|nr:hypothetical protein E1A91_D04G019400v1 [Gossypium mustelinum]